MAGTALEQTKDTAKSGPPASGKENTLRNGEPRQPWEREKGGRTVREKKEARVEQQSQDRREVG